MCLGGVEMAWDRVERDRAHLHVRVAEVTGDGRWTEPRAYTRDALHLSHPTEEVGG